MRLKNALQRVFINIEEQHQGFLENLYRNVFNSSLASDFPPGSGNTHCLNVIDKAMSEDCVVKLAEEALKLQPYHPKLKAICFACRMAIFCCCKKEALQQQMEPHNDFCRRKRQEHEELFDYIDDNTSPWLARVYDHYFSLDTDAVLMFDLIIQTCTILLHLLKFKRSTRNGTGFLEIAWFCQEDKAVKALVQRFRYLAMGMYSGTYREEQLGGDKVLFDYDKKLMEILSAHIRKHPSEGLLLLIHVNSKNADSLKRALQNIGESSRFDHSTIVVFLIFDEESALEKYSAVNNLPGISFTHDDIEVWLKSYLERQWNKYFVAERINEVVDAIVRSNSLLDLAQVDTVYSSLAETDRFVKGQSVDGLSVNRISRKLHTIWSDK